MLLCEHEAGLNHQPGGTFCSACHREMVRDPAFQDAENDRWIPRYPLWEVCWGCKHHANFDYLEAPDAKVAGAIALQRYQDVMEVRKIVHQIIYRPRPIAQILQDIITWDDNQQPGVIPDQLIEDGRDALLRFCLKCNVEKVSGQALMTTLVAGSPDFPGDERGITMSPGGPGVVVTCWKCPKCGHSVTK